MQLQRAEPLPCKNGMSNQCADFFLLQQTTYGFVLGSSHHQEINDQFDIQGRIYSDNWEK